MTNKYRSKLEAKVAASLGSEWEYEPFTVDYIHHKKYKPDFVKGKILIEVKGFFRVGDTAKYKAIAKDVTEQGWEFIMYLQSPNKPVRKGAKLTMSQWCDKNNIEWREVL